MIVINTPTDYEMQGQRESGLPWYKLARQDLQDFS